MVRLCSRSFVALCSALSALGFLACVQGNKQHVAQEHQQGKAEVVAASPNKHASKKEQQPTAVAAAAPAASVSTHQENKPVAAAASRHGHKNRHSETSTQAVHRRHRRHHRRGRMGKNLLRMKNGLKRRGGKLFHGLRRRFSSARKGNKRSSGSRMMKRNNRRRHGKAKGNKHHIKKGTNGGHGAGKAAAGKAHEMLAAPIGAAAVDSKNKGGAVELHQAAPGAKGELEANKK
ncbi:unnamed protein product [Amoebophrya sp. A120]|nr:unnamed protein product [Amoebophrya sp. A120]|eukprot:GSA120T00009334001.1